MKIRGISRATAASADVLAASAAILVTPPQVFGGLRQNISENRYSSGADRRDYRVKESDKFYERIRNKIIGGALFCAGIFALFTYLVKEGKKR